MPQLPIERVLRHSFPVSENNYFHSCPGNGDIHSTQVSQETNLSFIIAAHQGNNDNVSLLTLETIDGVNANLTTEGFKELFFHQQSPQILHLSTIG